jgi:hypothetical protein
VKKVLLMSSISVVGLTCVTWLLGTSSANSRLLVGSSGITLIVLALWLILFKAMSKNLLAWLKKRLAMEEQMGHIKAGLKIRKEVELLAQSPNFMNKNIWYVYFLNMDAEKVEKIGTEEELIKLRKYIKGLEEQPLFYARVLSIAGVCLVLIALMLKIFNI